MIQDKGSNYQFYNHTEKANPSKSVFDLSSLVTTTINNGGLIIPLKWFETLPGDKWELDFQALLRVMPQEVPLYSRQRMFIHAYYSRLEELWNEAQTYMTKGYTGKESLTKPVISSDNFDATLWNSGNGTVGVESLAQYLGLPLGAKYSDLAASGVTCLPFMMYERIYRDYYMNKNYYTENRQWLPNDDGDLRVNTNGEIISVVNNPNIPEGQEKITFGRLHYRDWTQDYFTSALPWPQRGEAMTLNIASGIQAFIEGTAPVVGDFKIPIENIYGTQTGYDTGERQELLDIYNPQLIFENNKVVGVSSGGEGEDLGSGTNFGFAIGKSGLSGAGYGASANEAKIVIDNSEKFGITANQLRELLLNQKELETMARTDGSYAEFGLAFFGEVSKTAKSYKPTYIGGTYQNITFGEVIQNGASTQDSPLGNFAGRGGMSTSGDLGTIYCDDYGYIMIIASIVPDTYYSQGLDRKWTRQTQEDEFLPDRAKLGMQAILNEELKFIGNPEKDKYGWAWQNRFDELRYEANTITGKIADPNNESFYPYTQARQFEGEEAPGYSQEFARMDDVRKDYLVSKEESAYIMQCAIGARAVRPLPYKAIPASLI